MIARILAIAWKDTLLLSRDHTAIVFTTAFPLLFAVVFGAMLGDVGAPPTVRLALVDQDATNLSARFADCVRANETIRIDIDNPNRPDATLTIPPGFADALQRVMTTGEPAPIIIEHPPDQRLAASLVEGASLACAWTTLLADRTEQLPSSGWTPIDVRRGNTPSISTHPPPSGFALSFAQAAVWAALGCAAAFGASLVAERASGTFRRLAAAPISKWAILIGKSIACVGLCVGVLVMLAGVGWAMFDVQFARPLELAAAILALALAAGGLMMLLATLGRSRSSAAQMAWGMNLVMALFGGAMIPLAIMPDWMRSVSVLSPAYWGIRAIEYATWRTGEPAQLAQALGVCLAVGLGGFAVGGLILARARRYD